MFIAVQTASRFHSSTPFLWNSSLISYSVHLVQFEVSTGLTAHRLCDKPVHLCEKKVLYRVKYPKVSELLAEL